MLRLCRGLLIVCMVAVVVGGVVVEGRTRADAPSLAGTWRVDLQTGGQPAFLLALGAGGTAISTDRDGRTRLGAWEVDDEGVGSITLEWLDDPGGPQGLVISGPVTVAAEDQVRIAEYSLDRVEAQGIAE